MTIHERFAALPRARKGSTRVVIVEESVLAELIADAQASEGDLMRQSSGPLTTISGGATGGAPMQIHAQVPTYRLWCIAEPNPDRAMVLAAPQMELEGPGLGSARPPGPQPARRRRPLMRAWILRLLLLPRPPRCGDDECVAHHG